MKKIIKLLSVGLFVVFVSGCTGEDKNILKIYTWAEYTAPEVLELFEKENNCVLELSTFDENEQMLAKLMSGGGGYDIIFPTSYVIPSMIKHGLIQNLNLSLLPNVQTNFDTKFSKFLLFDTMNWSVPYAFSYTGIAYRSDKLKSKIEDSWWCITNACFSGRVCILDDMREIIGIGNILCGKTVNDYSRSVLSNSVATAKKLKSYARKMDSLAYRTGLISDDFYIAFGYNSDIMQIKDENPYTPIQFFVPKEGSTCCFDEIVISKDCEKIELAHKFIDFLYRHDVAQKNYNYILSYIPNKTVTQKQIDDDVLSRLQLIRDSDDGFNDFCNAWDEIKR